jgi:hypothetical protein
MEISQTTTAAKSPANAQLIRVREVTHKAQMLKAANAAAVANRNQGQGKLE